MILKRASALTTSILSGSWRASGSVRKATTSSARSALPPNAEGSPPRKKVSDGNSRTP